MIRSPQGWLQPCCVATNMKKVLIGLGIAGIITAIGGVVSTILAARRARDEERLICEEKLRAIRIKAGVLAEELYELKARRKEQ